MQAEGLQQALLAALVPVDEADARAAVLEVRGGTGGEEAALFAGDLLRMYQAHCQSQGWRFEVRASSSGRGGRAAMLRILGTQPRFQLWLEGVRRATAWKVCLAAGLSSRMQDHHVEQKL